MSANNQPYTDSQKDMIQRFNAAIAEDKAHSLHRLVRGEPNHNMKTLLERQQDEYVASQEKVKQAAELLRDVETDQWPELIRQQLLKTRIELQYLRNQLCGMTTASNAEVSDALATE